MSKIKVGQSEPLQKKRRLIQYEKASPVLKETNKLGSPQNHMLYSPSGLIGGGTINNQIARMSDASVNEGEQHFMADQIGQVQGNSHLQRVINFIDKPNGKSKNGDNSNGSTPEQATDELTTESASSGPDIALTAPPPTQPSSSFIQTKTQTQSSIPHNVYKQQGYQIPKTVMRSTLPSEMTEDDLVQTKAAPEETPEVNSNIEGGIKSMQGKGTPLPDSERQFFESRMGQDFSQVRVHTDSQAVQLSRDLNARAFTVGGDIAFGEGEYQPGTKEGRRLMAHELTHVAQQGASEGVSPVAQTKKIDANGNGYNGNGHNGNGHNSTVNKETATTAKLPQKSNNGHSPTIAKKENTAEPIVEETTTEGLGLGGPPSFASAPPPPKNNGSTPTIQAKLTVNAPDDQYEQEADAVADQVMRMEDPKPQSTPAQDDMELSDVSSTASAKKAQTAPADDLPDTPEITPPTDTTDTNSLPAIPEAPQEQGKDPDAEAKAREEYEQKKEAGEVEVDEDQPEMTEEEIKEKKAEEKEKSDQEIKQKKEEAKAEGEKEGEETKKDGDDAKGDGEGEGDAGDQPMPDVGESEPATIDADEVKYNPDEEQEEPDMEPLLPTWDDLAAGTLQLKTNPDEEIDIRQALIENTNPTQEAAGQDAAGQEDVDKGSLIWDALSEGAMSGFKEGATNFVKDQAIQMATAKIPYADGLINSAQLLYDPEKWLDQNVWSIGKSWGKIGPGFSAIGDEDTLWGTIAATLEAVVNVIDLVNQVLGLINTILTMILFVAKAAVIVLSALIALAVVPWMLWTLSFIPVVTFLSNVIAFVDPINNFISAISNILLLVKFFMQPAIMVFRSLDILESKADPEALKKKQQKLKDATKGFIQSSTEKLGNSTKDAATAKIQKRIDKRKVRNSEKDMNDPKRRGESDEQFKERQTKAKEDHEKAKKDYEEKEKAGDYGTKKYFAAPFTFKQHIEGASRKKFNEDKNKNLAQTKERYDVYKQLGKERVVNNVKTVRDKTKQVGNDVAMKTPGLGSKSKTDRAENKVNKSKQKLQDAETNVKNKNDLHDQAVNKQTQKKQAVDDANTKVNTEKNKLKSIENRLNKAKNRKGSKTKREKAINRAKKQLAEQNEKLKTAEKNLQTAKNKKSAADKLVDKRVEQIKTANTKAKNAEEKLTVNQDKYNKAKEKLDTHQKGKDDATDNLNKRKEERELTHQKFKEANQNLKKALLDDVGGGFTNLTSGNQGGIRHGPGALGNSSKLYDFFKEDKPLTEEDYAKMNLDEEKGKLGMMKLVANTFGIDMADKIAEQEQLINKAEKIQSQIDPHEETKKWATTDKGKDYNIKPLEVIHKATNIPSGYQKTNDDPVFILKLGPQDGSLDDALAKIASSFKTVETPEGPKPTVDLVQFYQGFSTNIKNTKEDIPIKTFNDTREIMSYKGMGLSTVPKPVVMEGNGNTVVYQPDIENKTVEASSGKVLITVPYKQPEVPNVAKKPIVQRATEKTQDSAPESPQYNEDEEITVQENEVAPPNIEEEEVNASSGMEDQSSNDDMMAQMQSKMAEMIAELETEIKQANAEAETQKTKQESPETEAETETSTDDVDLQDDVESETESESEIEIEPEIDDEIETEPELDADADDEVEVEPDTDAEFEAEKELQAELQAQGEAEREVETDGDEDEDGIDYTTLAELSYEAGLLEALPEPPENMSERIEGLALAYSELDDEEYGMHHQTEQMEHLQAHAEGQLADRKAIRSLTEQHQEGVRQHDLDIETKLEGQAEMKETTEGHEDQAEKTSEKGEESSNALGGIFSSLLSAFGLGAKAGAGEQEADSDAAKEGTEDQAKTNEDASQATKDATKLSEQRAEETLEVQAGSDEVKEELQGFDEVIAEEEESTEEGISDLDDLQEEHQGDIGDIQEEKERLSEEHQAAVEENEEWADEHESTREEFAASLEETLSKDPEPGEIPEIDAN